MTGHATQGILPLLAAASLLITACSDDSSSVTKERSPTTPSSSAPGDSTHPSWELLSNEPEGVPLAAGTYGLTPGASSEHVAVVQAPGGYEAYGGWTFVTGEEQPRALFHAVGILTADQVYPDPCASTRSKAAMLRDPGPTVADLAEALVAQQGVTTSTPRPVTLDGHRGLYLDYEVSKGVDVRDCGDEAFDIFGSAAGASWYLEAARERAAIWILDVDGERLVLSWVAFPGVSDSELDEMTAMAESARFVESE
ncbi:hypothetical protein ACT8ZV_17400 [Nocardioides sp. MAHUQ-72]|uniref:hypothetical protein n=1 Tax=unclassified Nocardioides TaxID=2615069 RepID=UPI003620FA49